MAPKLDWLQTRLELDAAQLKLVVAQPTLLGYGVDANMAPTLDWLQIRLDLDDAGLRKAVLVKPQLLNYSVEDNMAPTLEWLQTRLDLDDAGLRKVVLGNLNCWATASRTTWSRSWIGYRRVSNWTRRS